MDSGRWIGRRISGKRRMRGEVLTPCDSTETGLVSRAEEGWK